MLNLLLFFSCHYEIDQSRDAPGAAAPYGRRGILPERKYKPDFTVAKFLQSRDKLMVSKPILARSDGSYAYQTSRRFSADVLVDMVTCVFHPGNISSPVHDARGQYPGQMTLSIIIVYPLQRIVRFYGPISQPSA